MIRITRLQRTLKQRRYIVRMSRNTSSESGKPSKKVGNVTVSSRKILASLERQVLGKSNRGEIVLCICHVCGVVCERICLFAGMALLVI